MQDYYFTSCFSADCILFVVNQKKVIPKKPFQAIFVIAKAIIISSNNQKSPLTKLNKKKLFSNPYGPTDKILPHSSPTMYGSTNKNKTIQRSFFLQKNGKQRIEVESGKGDTVFSIVDHLYK
jgi:hypothetical protein